VFGCIVENESLGML